MFLMKKKTSTIKILAWLFFLVAIFFLYASRSKADNEHMHQHPQQDAHLHDTFYSKWMQHDGKTSCCNDKDCYPTKAHKDPVTGRWYAERREDHKMIRIPLY